MIQTSLPDLEKSGLMKCSVMEMKETSRNADMEVGVHMTAVIAKMSELSAAAGTANVSDPMDPQVTLS